jgi:L-threonylcarbamoyladenylate synthase
MRHSSPLDTRIPDACDAAEIVSAAAVLRAGELVAFPTETVYGLGADARNEQALRKIFEVKGRPADHPLILHLATTQELAQWVGEIPQSAYQLASAFWPGPLTVVLPRHARVSKVLTGGQDSIAVRVPSHPVAQALLRVFGSGIAAPSANRYGHISPTSAQHVKDEFGDMVHILSGGDCEVGVESTIVSLIDKTPRILRPGMITQAQIAAVLQQPVHAMGTTQAVPRMPGSTLQHYAPRTPLEVLPPEALQAAIEVANAAGERVAVLAREAPATQSVIACGDTPAFVLQWVQAPADATGFAHDLYANLRELDKLGAQRILVESVPEDPEWDAVRDRLQRASACL